MPSCLYRNGSVKNYAGAKNVFCSTRPQDAHGNKSRSVCGLGMIEQTIYAPEAEDDIADSYDWYEIREPGLGEDFLRCVEACILGIQRHPNLYPFVVDAFRRALVRRFPFEIFYELGGDCIIIYAV